MGLPGIGSCSCSGHERYCSNLGINDMETGNFLIITITQCLKENPHICLSVTEEIGREGTIGEAALAIRME